MDLQVHSLNFDADKKLIEFVNQKVGKLNQYFDRIVSGDVILRIDKSNESGNKVAEIKLNIPGKELFAKKQCKSFEEATDLACEALRRQVKRHKEKLVA
ncbi:MAG: ribosome-associated translation inhibitor RaiA [Crocinitomicaceae bacterium]|nr:ribosome-associated translation inhibitor RaiA [Crocinitomicaceae bacterium]